MGVVSGYVRIGWALAARHFSEAKTKVYVCVCVYMVCVYIYVYKGTQTAEARGKVFS